MGASGAIHVRLLNADAALGLGAGLVRRGREVTRAATRYARPLALSVIRPPFLDEKYWPETRLRMVAERGRKERLAAQHDTASLVRAVVAAVLDQIDLTTEVLQRVDLDAIVAKVDADAIVARVDLDAIIDRVPIERVVARVDIDEVAARLDLDRIVERLDLRLGGVGTSRRPSGEPQRRQPGEASRPQDAASPEASESRGAHDA